MSSTAPMSTSNAITIRPASLSDLDSLVGVRIASSLSTPSHSYRFPYASLYPADHYDHIRLKIAEFLALAATGSHSIMVAEMSSNEDCGVSPIVALSIWRMPGTLVLEKDGEKTSHSLLHALLGDESRADWANESCFLPVAVAPTKITNPPGRDANPSHIQAWNAAIAAGKRELFNAAYGDDQFFLKILDTHPEYRRRGAGTLLCEWGIARAKEQGKAVMLFATAMGAPLYGKLGFRTLGVVKVQVEGEEEKLELKGMVWEGVGG